MEREHLAEVLSYIPDDFELPNAVMPAIYKRLGMKIRFLTVTFGERAGGVQSLNAKRIIRIGLRAVPAFLKISQEVRT